MVKEFPWAFFLWKVPPTMKKISWKEKEKKRTFLFFIAWTYNKQWGQYERMSSKRDKKTNGPIKMISNATTFLTHAYEEVSPVPSKETKITLKWKPITTDCFPGVQVLENAKKKILKVFGDNFWEIIKLWSWI